MWVIKATANHYDVNNRRVQDREREYLPCACAHGKVVFAECARG